MNICYNYCVFKGVFECLRKICHYMTRVQCVVIIYIFEIKEFVLFE